MHKRFFFPFLITIFLASCASAPRIAPPQKIVAPTPIQGNAGRYMSPYTQDGTVTLWVEKGRSASAGANVGGFLGAQAGQKLAGQIPFVGGLIGQQIGEKAGRAIALEMVGGEEFIRANSDLSFDNVDDLAIYMYAKNSGHKDYPAVLDLTQKIYPELQNRYYQTLLNASKGRI